jgi:hypothetical protein
MDRDHRHRTVPGHRPTSTVYEPFRSMARHPMEHRLLAFHPPTDPEVGPVNPMEPASMATISMTMTTSITDRIPMVRTFRDLGEAWTIHEVHLLKRLWLAIRGPIWTIYKAKTYVCMCAILNVRMNLLKLNIGGCQARIVMSRDSIEVGVR